MKFFKSKPKNEPAAVQMVPSQKSSHPFGGLDSYTPFSLGEQHLYESLRESVPIIDAAICKIVRLVGGFSIASQHSAVQAKLNHFLSNVQVNSSQRGVEAFIASYLDSLLTHGTAVGEIVPNSRGAGVAALYNVPLKNVQLLSSNSPLQLRVFRKDSTGKASKVQYQELILISSLNPSPGQIYGTPLLKGLPFVSGILLKIYNTIGVNWERVGNIRFAVTYKPGPDAGEQTYTRERVMQVAEQWKKAMNNSAGVCDFISVGDVSIKVIGADNQILNSEIPVRQMLEQIVAKLSIPPFLLGLSWSTSEKMSAQQADILTSELESYRRLLNPIISKICSMWLRMHALPEDFEIIWRHINLQDETERAKARLDTARAQCIEARC